jgi:hypothetical protein
MKKHIIISQGTLDLSRDRLRRRLTAILDSDKGLNTNLTNLDTGEESNFSNANFTSFQSSPVQCPHKSYCPSNITHYSMKCSFGASKCKIKPFYDRYGRYADELNIGSKL